MVPKPVITITNKSYGNSDKHEALNPGSYIGAKASAVLCNERLGTQRKKGEKRICRDIFKKCVREHAGGNI